MISNIFNRISFAFLFLVIILLPAFFLPFTKIPVEISKSLFLVVGLAVSIIFWIIARFFDGKISLPKSLCLLSGFGIVVAFLLSSIFSPAVNWSFFGTIFDVGTFWFVFSSFLFMLVSSVVVQNNKQARLILLGIIISSATVLIFQIFHLFLPKILPFGVLVSKTDNIFGSWNALGIFAGFLGVISLSVIEFFHISRMAKWILGILLPLSIFFTAIVNFSLIWALLGIFALIIFVFKTLSYSVAKQTENDNVRFPAFSLAVFAISLLFFMSGQFIGEFLPNRLGISRAEEVTPTLTTTMLIAKKTLTKDPIFGAGPNRFGEMWAMHKTASINSGRFWDTYFDFGSGLLPTFAVTTGIVGIIAWLAFFYMFFITGMKSIFFTIKKRVNPEMMVFFMASFYLFTASFFYPTGIVMFFLAFIFAGVFVGLSVGNGSSSEISLSFFNNPVKSFFSTIFLVFLMIFTIVASFKFMERFVSVSYFGKTLMAPTIPIAESSITKAIMLNSNDLYLRTYAQVYLVKLNSQIAENSSGEGGANVALQATFDQAVNGAILATTYNSTNYLNFKALGVVYESVASLGVLGAYDKAIESYKTASDLNPLNPALKLSIARVSFASDKTKEAKDYGEQAITLKPDYIEALIVLSQITKSEGDIRQALSYAERALSFSPSDKDLIQYVNSLR